MGDCEGAGAQAFWHDIRKDLTPRELDVPRLIMKKAEFEVDLSGHALVDCTWEERPMDLLTAKVCLACAHALLHAVAYFKCGTDCPLWARLTRSIRHAHGLELRIHIFFPITVIKHPRHSTTFIDGERIEGKPYFVTKLTCPSKN